MSTNYWSGEPIVVERKDLHTANCMAVHQSGRLAVLAGRRQVALVELRRPRATLHQLHPHHKYDAGVALWSRAPPHQHCLAVSYNSQVCVLRLDETGSQLLSLLPEPSVESGSGGGRQQLRRLQSHRRVITDLDWHWRRSALATCSVDASIHVWDLRDLRRPAAATSSVECVTQVKWSRTCDYTLTSSHEGDVRVWDMRKFNIPEHYISAHTAKIHCLDWCPFQENQLVSAGQDMYIKLMDVTDPRSVQTMTKLKDPVWRARFTPFGRALVTVVVSPQLRRGDNCLCLWNADNASSPVHTFLGHTDAVLEFDWRYREEDGEYDLVTWSRDQTLRLWQVEHHMLQLCGHDVTGLTAAVTGVPDDKSTTAPAAAAARTAPPLTPPATPPLLATVSGMVPRTLQQEFAMLNRKIDNVRIEDVDVNGRSCRLCVMAAVDDGALCDDDGADSVAVLRLLVTFPPAAGYPCRPQLRPLPLSATGAASRPHLLTDQQLQQLLASWQLTAEQQMRCHSACLEPCVRQLAAQVRAMTSPLVSAAAAAAGGSSGALAATGGAPDVAHTARVVKTYSEVVRQQRVPLNSVFPSGNMYSSFKDMSVPFPRTSGARFCGNDTLCVFACPMYMKRLSTCGESVTPRSLSALDVYLVNYAHGSLKRPLIGSGSVSRPLIGCGSVSSRPLIGSDSVPRPLIGSGSTNNDTEHNGVLSQRGERGTTRAAASPGGSLPSPTAGVRQKASVMTESVGSRTSASSRHQQLLTLVLCYDSSRLTLLDRQLAMDYRLFNGQRDRVQPSVNSTDGKSTDDERFAAVCRHNAGCAAAAGRRDLERMWHVLAVCVALMSGGDDGDSWQTSVAAYSTCTQPRTVQMFARRLIANLLDHYMRLRDIQTVAVVLCMLVGWSCRVTARHHTPPHTTSGGATSRRDGEAGSGGALAQPGDGNRRVFERWAVKFNYLRKLGESPYRTVQTVDSCRYPSLQQAVFYGRAGSAGGASVARQSRSNSWTDEASCAAAAAAASVATNGGMLVATVSGDAASGGDRQACTASPQHLLSLVDGSRLAEFSSHVHTYAEVLYNWRMLIERADVMKHVASFRSAASGGATSSGGGGQYGMEVRSRCGRCWLTFVGTECPVCHRCTSKCALCQTPVKGMSAFCLVCGHGGHLAHVRDWFSRRRTCPAGCSCKCQHVFQQTFESV